MWQVLFRIPISFEWAPDGIPIYGFGLMLFLAYLLGIRLATRRARAEGISSELIHDLSICIFIGGLVGARITYLLAHEKIFEGRCDSVSAFFSAFWDFLKALPRIWDGGIILYGSILGGLVTYALLYWFIYRKRGINTLQLADIFAPSIALGVCLGRLGCLCNGCCYGQVHDPSMFAIHFPLAAAARFDLTQDGFQTAAGFTMDTNLATVEEIQRGHQDKGLQPGDVITNVNNREVTNALVVDYLAQKARLRGQTELTLEVIRGNELVPVTYRMPALGFTIDQSGKIGDPPRIKSVEANSAAASAGLQPGDQLIALEDNDKVQHPLTDPERDLTPFLTRNLALRLVVERAGKEIKLGAFNVPALGFQTRDVTTRVGQVVPESPAARAGLQPGDVIVEVNDQQARTYGELTERLTSDWPRGASDLQLKVERGNERKLLPAFTPRTIGLHPTQIYESISLFLLFLTLLAYTPLRQSYGQVIALLAIGYALHRYLNEILRIDARPGPFESISSIVLLVFGVALFVWLWYRPLPLQPPPPEPAKPVSGLPGGAAPAAS